MSFGHFTYSFSKPGLRPPLPRAWSQRSDGDGEVLPRSSVPRDQGDSHWHADSVPTGRCSGIAGLWVSGWGTAEQSREGRQRAGPGACQPWAKEKWSLALQRPQVEVLALRLRGSGQGSGFHHHLRTEPSLALGPKDLIMCAFPGSPRLSRHGSQADPDSVLGPIMVLLWIACDLRLVRKEPVWGPEQWDRGESVCHFHGQTRFDPQGVIPSTKLWSPESHQG